jgi:hypothetical protein
MVSSMGLHAFLKKIDIPTGRLVPSGKVWVQFQDKDVGKNLRKNSKHCYKRDMKADWTPIEPVMKQYHTGHRGQALVHVYNFPYDQLTQKQSIGHKVILLPLQLLTLQPDEELIICIM